MSAFLGPIHVKMYDRILYQDAMARTLLDLAEQKGWADGLRESADTKAPEASAQPLEDIIDPANIHGWLGRAVAGCECRFAAIAGAVADGDPQRLNEMRHAMREMGRQRALPATLDAQGAFEAVHDILLDGMPCDFPFDVTESGADVVVWRVSDCPLAPYWQAENGNPETYYLLRDAWLEGALENSGIVHARSNGGHSLRKEG